MRGGDPADRRRRGREAEALAEAWLRRQGFEVLDRNHATRRGEVDLVCREAGTVCFVEVRSRRDAALGSPLLTVTPAKARRVAAAAADWAARRAPDAPLRFDLLGVTLGPGGPTFELVRGAFDGDGRPGLW
jgi:putative endonuclease